MSSNGYAAFKATYKVVDLPDILKEWYEEVEMFGVSSDRFTEVTTKQVINVIIGIALEDANSIRRALAIGEGILPELPKGIPGNEQMCVLAKALSNGWAPFVDAEEASVYHEIDSQRELARHEMDVQCANAAEALKQMGYACWGGVVNNVDSDIPSSVEDSFQIDPNPGEAEEDKVWVGKVRVDLTWSMRKLIELFDAKFIPELILERSYSDS
jgi:hypothetical protein